ncbi:hypothetical protein NLJ89_g9422 [Agrocybe chaxingu]|uniref:MYND-type domain-containing protein n=1 Tax=Agrocybe chaxingu TaxID=84603 RepID=A0A9W8JVV5_9AGAR|nr:hypothetical protein NLJ89_g9422 [Agrocybe chaxingu]
MQQQEESMDYTPSPADSSTSHILLLSDSASQPNSDTDASTDNSIAATPQGSGTPTGSVLVPARDRSGTIIARPVWDQPATAAPRRARHRELPPESPSDVSRAETETEDDGDIDMDHSRDSRRLAVDSDVASASASPSPERRSLNRTQHMARRAVGIVSDEPATGPEALQVSALGLDADAHIIINEGGGVGVGDGVEVGVEDGIVSLEQNDDFAMGAPPGAPGAIGEGTTPRGLNLEPMVGRRRNTDAPDVTPRAAIVGLPMTAAATTNGTIRGGTPTHPPIGHGHQRNATIRGRPPTENAAAGPATTRTTATAATPANILPGRSSNISSNAGHRDSDSGPYRDEDVLLSLQLLAYLSKYPHVRQAFYKPRVTFHPASVNLPGARFGVGQSSKDKQKETAKVPPTAASSTKESIFRAFTNAAASVGSSRGKDKQPASSINASTSSTSSTHTHATSSHAGAPSSARQTNVFSLVERFTFKPSSTETDLPNPPPRLPPEIQYWAGVIMRNACRKDDSRGGIRQCANMMCGKWETYPREFAKCRRCRKAKYCGKECQSTAWSEGHRFWCSAKDVDEDNTNTTGDHSTTAATTDQSNGSIQIAPDATGLTEVQVTAARTERRAHRERTHAHAHHHPVQPATNYVSPTTTLTGARAETSMSRDRTVQPLPQHQHQARTRPATNTRLGTSQAQDPMNTSYLTFQIQGQSPSAASSSSSLANALSPTHEQAGRRRAETITGATMPSSASSGSTSRMMEVPPNVILPRITTQQPSQQQDWPMGGTSPVPPHASVSVPSPSRRYRPTPPPMARGSLFDNGEDDMVLG